MKTVELLLTENVDHLGIVGDVVKVRPGHARNYLIPLGLATKPTEGAVPATFYITSDGLILDTITVWVAHCDTSSL